MCLLFSFKAKHEKKIADFQQQIHIREHKMAEVRSSELACKVKTNIGFIFLFSLFVFVWSKPSTLFVGFQAGLDAEWLQVNNFFTTIVKIVEGVRQTASQPVNERLVLWC